MDSLTAAVALVIDNDPGELEWACCHAKAWEESRARRAQSPIFDDPDGWVAARLADELRERICDGTTDGLSRSAVPQLARMYISEAVSHMYTHTDWRALAQHYMDKVAEGV